MPPGATSRAQECSQLEHKMQARSEKLGGNTCPSKYFHIARAARAPPSEPRAFPSSSSSMCQTPRNHRRSCFWGARSAGKRTEAACTAAQCRATPSALPRPPNWKSSRKRAASRQERLRAPIYLRRLFGRSRAPRRRLPFRLCRTAQEGRGWPRIAISIAQRCALRSAETAGGECVGKSNSLLVHCRSRVLVCSASHSARGILPRAVCGEEQCYNLRITNQE